MLEARLHRSFSHPNVVKLYGVAAGQEPLMLVMELADSGALDSLLQKKEQTAEKKTEMCMQAAWGLEYLHSRKVLHRDIAARNCLYGDGRVKVSSLQCLYSHCVLDLGLRSDPRGHHLPDGPAHARAHPLAGAGDAAHGHVQPEDGRVGVRHHVLGDLQQRLRALPGHDRRRGQLPRMSSRRGGC